MSAATLLAPVDHPDRRDGVAASTTVQGRRRSTGRRPGRPSDEHGYALFLGGLDVETTARPYGCDPYVRGRRSVSAVPNEAPGVTGDAATERASPEALMRAIHEQYRGPLLRFLTRLLLGRQELAEDLVQETFLRTWRNLETLAEDPRRIAPWLYTVARHVAIDAMRARQARPPEVAIPDLNRLASAEDEMDRVVSTHTVRLALQQIKPEHREVLVEMYYKGSSVAEAAQRLGIPEGTVKSRTYYAVRALHAAIGPTESS